MTGVRQRLAFEPFTFAHVKDLPENGNRYQIIDGCLGVTANSTAAHQLIINKLCERLSAAGHGTL